MAVELDIEQGSPDWFEARRGVITATRAADLLDTTKAGKFTAARDTVICEIAMERLGGDGRAPIVGGATLQRGHDFEDEAAQLYAYETGRVTRKCGFLIHSDYPQFGCSPDRLVGDDGMLEIKVPMCIKKMVSYLLEGAHATEYLHQITHQLYVSGREWVDITPYDNRAPEGLQMAIHTIKKPDTWDEYEAKLMAADNAIEDMVERLGNLQVEYRKAA